MESDSSLWRSVPLSATVRDYNNGRVSHERRDANAGRGPTAKSDSALGRSPGSGLLIEGMELFIMFSGGGGLDPSRDWGGMPPAPALLGGPTAGAEGCCCDCDGGPCELLMSRWGPMPLCDGFLDLPKRNDMLAYAASIEADGARA